jgi:DNA modification methylase
MEKIGPFQNNTVIEGDCLELIKELPNESIDIVVTSPPYWGQRISKGAGTEEDPRDYLKFLKNVFVALLPKLKKTAVVWINIGDAYNTPINWGFEDIKYSSLGENKCGLSPNNTAYTKPRAKRKAFIDISVPWLTYGNLLALPYRLIIALCDEGYYFRGEVIWNKKNPLPEGKCRRPHRKHESIYLLSKDERHNFQLIPPIKSVWEFPNEKIVGKQHYSRFPEDLPLRCIEAYNRVGRDIVVLDPFTGSGTTGIAAKKLNCTFIGFEIDPEQVVASNNRIKNTGYALPLIDIATEIVNR